MQRFWDGVVLVLLVAVVVAAPMIWVAYRNGQPLGVGASDVTAVQVFDPTQPPERAFTSTPQPFSTPITPLLGAIPTPLPHPVWQGLRCSGGRRLMISLSDNSTITYGPCRYPEGILSLYATVFSIQTGGACEPSCGPNGANVAGEVTAPTESASSSPIAGATP